MSSLCGDLLAGGPTTWIWLFAAAVAGVLLGRRTLEEARRRPTTPGNLAAIAVVIAFAVAALVYVAGAPDERCDSAYTSILIMLIPVALTGFAVGFIGRLTDRVRGNRRARTKATRRRN